MRSQTESQHRAHPELALVLALEGHLELLPVVLASVHTSEDSGALSDQARSMARVSRVLADQVRAYVGMLEANGEGKRFK